MMRDSTEWHVDGTFKTCPAIFYQMVTIQCVIQTKIVHAAYALVENKNKATYTAMITAIKSICHDNGYNVKPKSVLSDFEPALQDAFALAFDNISIKGCWFHYVQCIVRRIRHDGLIQRYENDYAFRVWVKQFTALAMIRTDSLEEAFEINLNTCPDLNDTSIQKFLSYFINEWLVGQVSPDVWNHHQRQRRTNNDLEHHPNLAKFVKFIQQNHGVSKDIY